MAGNVDIPVLEGDAAAAVAHRGGHIQIIAAAGAGKTEVVSQRVADLLQTEPPESIVAFTFTEKAAVELKERIRHRVTARFGDEMTDRLGRLFVGTIHSYCLRLLQTFVPEYETYTPLDANQLVNLLYREAYRLQLKQFDTRNRVFAGVDAFLRNVDVIENELIPVESLPEGPFRTAVERHYAMLDGYRFMSFGTQIVRAVDALENPAIHAKVTAELRHLIVDEYQDVNPSQERLIELLSRPLGSADLVVVGDDDQAIYQWRGSNVSNIVTFAERFAGVTQFRLLENRRSRPGIVEVANAFAQTIPGRLDKEMLPTRQSVGADVMFAIGHDDEETEASSIAMAIETLHAGGVPYRDIAILVRGKVAYPRILDALEAYGVPVQPGGRTGLFAQPDAALLGSTYAWISDVDWSTARFETRRAVSLDDLLAEYTRLHGLEERTVDRLRKHLEAWKGKSAEKDLGVSLVGDLYILLEILGVSAWDVEDEKVRNRLGTIGRFTNVLADYEAVTRRARRDADNPGEQVGGTVGDEWFYRNLALVLVNYATGSYNDFEGEDDQFADGVALGTVHGAKGLEWPVVFLPSLTERRFPSSKVGQAGNWLVPTELFDASRYEGDDADERRLFYVALTRARDWVSPSSHLKVNKQSRRTSPYLLECAAVMTGGQYPSDVEPRGADASDLTVTYSELAAFAECPQSYLLRNQLGFMPPIEVELGYGNAVHHLMRVIAEQTKERGRVPSEAEIDALLDSNFYLPFANKPAHKEMRKNAKRLVTQYLTQFPKELERTWATEHPFELYLPGVVVSGRADVIYDEDAHGAENLVIVDYKTATGGEVEPLQLQVYADAGVREGLTVQGAFIHDMATADRHTVDVSEAAIENAEQAVLAIAERLTQRDFAPTPEASKCRRCDVRSVCKAAKLR